MGLLDARRTAADTDSPGSGSTGNTITYEQFNSGVGPNGPLTQGANYTVTGGPGGTQTGMYNQFGTTVNGQATPALMVNNQVLLTANSPTNTGNGGGGSSPSTGFKVPAADPQLPWYPQTFGAGPGTYRNLRDQIGQSLVEPNYGANDFKRWHISHGGPGDQTTWEGWGKAPPTQTYPLPGQTQPNVTPPPPYNPGPLPTNPPYQPGPGTAPVTSTTRPQTAWAAGMQAAQQRSSTPNGLLGGNNTQPTRTTTPNSGLLGGTTGVQQRTTTPYGGLLTDTSANTNPMLRSTTPWGQAATSEPVGGHPRGAADSRVASSPVATPQQYSSTAGIDGFRFSGGTPQEQNYNYLAQTYNPQVAQAYMAALGNGMTHSLYSQASPEIAVQMLNASHAGSTGSRYSGGGVSGDGSSFWTGMSPEQAAQWGLAKNAYNMYTINLPGQAQAQAWAVGTAGAK